MRPDSRNGYGFQALAKPTGAACNLACKYCFFLPKEALYPASRFRMNDRVMERYIGESLATQPGPEATIAWQGGEPTLMGLDFFRRSVACAQKHSRPGHRVRHVIQTNGTRIDDT